MRKLTHARERKMKYAINIAIAFVAIIFLAGGAVGAETAQSKVTTIASASQLTLNDFKEPEVGAWVNGEKVETSLKDNKIVLSKSVEEGDSIKVIYPVEPADVEAAKKAVDRTYTVKTDLKNGLIKASVYYRNGGGQALVSSLGKDYLDVKVSDWEEGLDEINVTVQGEVPVSSDTQFKAIGFDIQNGQEDTLPKVIVRRAQAANVTPILSIDAPSSSYVGEEVEIKVYSNCFLANDTEVCSSLYNPVSGANVEITSVPGDELIAIGVTNESGVFETVFDEPGQYLIEASKDGYISANKKIIILPAPTPTATPIPTPITEGGLTGTATSNEECLVTSIGSIQYTEPVEVCRVNVTGSVDGETFTDTPAYYKEQQDIEIGDNLAGYVALYPDSIDGYTDGYWIEKKTPAPTPTPTPLKVSGAVFPILPELKQELKKDETVQKALSLNPYPFIFVSETGFHIVLWKKIVGKGLGHVEGRKIGEVSWKGIDFSVINASSVNVETEGERATIREILQSPSKYNLKLVKVNGNKKEFTWVVCPFDVPVLSMSAGVITDNPEAATLKNLASNAKDLVRGSQPYSQMYGLEDTIPFFTYDIPSKPEYWKDCNAEVNGIIFSRKAVTELGIKDELRMFIKQVQGEQKVVSFGDVLMYMVKEKIEIDDHTDVESIIQNPERFRGKTVTLDENSKGVGISTRKVLEKFGVDVPLDVNNQLLCSLDGDGKKLLLLGASSHFQEKMVKEIQGNFEITGKVVSAKQLYKRFPDITAIWIFRREVEGISSLSVEQEKALESKVNQHKDVIISSIKENPPKPTPTPAPGLENLSVSIEPEHREARPGDSINYSITVDWRPPEWRGELKATAVISAAGFSKTYELPKVRPEHDPPITNDIQIPLPDNIPPLTYTMKLTVGGDSLKASDETELKVKSAMPGFEAVFAVAGLLAVAYLIRKR